MMTKETISHTLHDTYHWATVRFWVAPDADLEHVERLALEAATGVEDYLDIEEPRFWVITLEKDAVECWVASWADSPAHAWRLQHTMRMKLLKSLREHNISTQRLEIKDQRTAPAPN